MIDNIIMLFSLTFLQLILMIDNLIFISVMTDNLEKDVKAKARRYGLFISLVMNSVLILLAGFLTNINNTLFTVYGHAFNFHNILLFFGGLFLIYKTVKEIRCKIDKVCDHNPGQKVFNSLTELVINMALIDLVFSIDSTIIAIGMSDIRWIQMSSILMAIVIMFFCFNAINKITDKYPSLKIISLSFLLLIGFSLFTSGLGIEIPKGYVYFAMLFCLLVEFINIKTTRK